MKSNSKACILIVDDKPANILALESLLSAKHRQLLTASSGSEALHITLNKNIDLIILDVQMPEMNGFEVAQILKSNKRTRDIPIIFATAENKDHKFIMQGYDEGAIDYLFKPLDPQIVKAKVNVLLKLQLQKKELIEKNNSLQKSALLIDNSADIIGIIDAKTFKINEINKAFTTILGYTASECMDSSLSFYLGSEDRIKLQALAKETKERLSFETLVYCKDRTTRWLHWNVVVKSGKWFVNARDITDIKEVERIRNYLGTVVKQSNDAIYIHDSEGRIISWNKGAEKIYGYSEEEALMMKIWNIIPEFMQSETGEIVGQILNGKKIEDMDTRRVTKTGKLVDVLFSASVIAEAGENDLSVAITEKDITRQKIAEEKLKENERFLTSILDTMTEAVIVTDGDGKALLMNPAAKRLFGSNLNKEIRQWFDKAGLYYPYTADTFKQEEFPLVQILEGKETSHAEIFIKNEFVPGGVFVIASSTPLKNFYSEITGAVCVIHDISERILAEEALRESELRFRNLFEYAPYPMWVYNIDTLDFMEVNQSAIKHYGYSREEFHKMKITDIRRMEDLPKLLNDIKKPQGQWQTEWQHQLRNGRLIDVEITSHHIDFRGQKAALVIAKDITDQKKAEEKILQLNTDLLSNIGQLEAANKELESFSYSVSHDLRAPLRGLNGYSTMLEEDYANVLDDEGNRLLGRIKYNAQKMGVLIDDLLNFSRLGRKDLQKAPLNMVQIAEDVVTEISSSLSHHAKIKINSLPAADADLSLIRQVWINLVSNAIKYSGKKENPEVEIGSLDSDKEIIYYVKDNGTGFDMKYADKLFGVFQRLHNRSDYEGTGIGLAIVQRIVAKHGGRVWAEAKENEGACFYFTLPHSQQINIVNNESVN